MNILKSKNVVWKERRLINNLYIKDSGKSNRGKTGWFDIGRVARQGCCLSPTLFNLYIYDMVHNILNEEEKISIEERRRIYMSFIDDMMILAY